MCKGVSPAYSNWPSVDAGHVCGSEVLPHILASLAIPEWTNCDGKPPCCDSNIRMLSAMPFFSEILCPSVSVVPSIAYLKAGRMPRDTKLRHSMQLLNCVMLYWVALVGAVRLIIEDIKTHKFFNE
ncbi:hypothetical protein AB3S75_026274 [Citrus x aurantiifolia]